VGRRGRGGRALSGVTRDGEAGAPRADAHPFVSTSLFVDITTITVDPSYVAAAARRAADPDPRPPRPTSLLALGALLAVGTLCGVAAHQTRDRAPAAARIRASLVSEAQRRSAATDLLAEQELALRRETAAARDAQLRQSAAGRALSEELARLELAVGGGRVSGPGLVVTLSDGPDAGEDEGRISDTDVQAVVNALWAAGAEAVAVNDRRISALTAIREAGEAILVDYRPVTPPYVVRAIGDPDAMDPAFNLSPTAGRFRTWVDAFGLRFDVGRAERLDLPAAETTRLRHATARRP
jgi:uncharacterized protein YlxW (UPF0749 family)